jgi:hypothetical protein
MNTNPLMWKILQQQAAARHMAANAAQDYRNPQVWAQMQQQMSNMDPATKYLYAKAHNIPAAAIGMYPQTINYLEQSLMGFTMDKRTGQILQQNGDGSNTPIAPGQLQTAVQSRNGADITQTGGMALNGINQATYGMGVGGRQGLASAAYAAANPMSGFTPPGSNGGNNSNVGGGAGNPNNVAGLGGSAGNALRQMFMTSDQFNPNGANTYAIQNMNLSGQGDLGSNMGGMPQNGLFGGAVPTAQGTGQTTGTPMPTQTGAPTPAPQYQQAGTPITGTGVTTPQTTQTKTPSYFGGALPATRPQGYTGTRQQYMQSYGGTTPTT